MRKHFCRNILVNVAHNVAWASKQKGRKTFCCFRDDNSTNSNHVAWVCKRGNIGETFKVSVSSVFPKCFFFCAPTQRMWKTKNLHLESKKFQKHSRRNFVSETMFPRLRRRSGFKEASQCIHMQLHTQVTFSKSCSETTAMLMICSLTEHGFFQSFQWWEK